MITVACVLRSGGRYDESWVHKLKAGVARHLTIPHRFVCLTDMAPDCDVIPLVTDWPHWWSKLELFRPDILDGRVLYFDLDTVVVGSLDAIASYPHHFTMAHEYYRPEYFCSTAMAWEGDYRDIYHLMLPEIIRKYDVDRPDGRIGDQAYIEDVLKVTGHRVRSFKDLFGERSVASYKVHCRSSGLDGTESVVAFHGSLKPDDLNHVDWVRRAWHG